MSSGYTEEIDTKDIAINCLLDYFQDELISLFFETKQLYASVNDLPDYLRSQIAVWVDETNNYQEYNLSQASEILDKYKAYQASDEGLWIGEKDARKIISIQAVYTFRYAVSAHIDKMLKAFSEKEDEFDGYWQEYDAVFDWEDTEENRETMGEFFRETIQQVDL